MMHRRRKQGSGRLAGGSGRFARRESSAQQARGRRANPFGAWEKLSVDKLQLGVFFVDSLTARSARNSIISQMLPPVSIRPRASAKHMRRGHPTAAELRRVTNLFNGRLGVVDAVPTIPSDCGRNNAGLAGLEMGCTNPVPPQVRAMSINANPLDRRNRVDALPFSRPTWIDSTGRRHRDPGAGGSPKAPFDTGPSTRPGRAS
eukprot:scaffold228_cov312-Pinguiococcus_pyrenoidosus.AAC.31